MKETLAMTDQTTTTVGSRAGTTGPPRHGQAPSPRDLAARAPGNQSAPSPGPRRPGDESGAAAPVMMTGAQTLVAALEQLGVDVVFGIPGGAILPAYDPLFDSRKVRHILVRHEQGAGHAAAGYAQVTGRPAAAGSDLILRDETVLRLTDPTPWTTVDYVHGGQILVLLRRADC